MKEETENIKSSDKINEEFGLPPGTYHKINLTNDLKSIDIISPSSEMTFDEFSKYAVYLLSVLVDPEIQKKIKDDLLNSAEQSK